MEWLIATLASGLAGFVDSIVGGGGLVLAPALFALFPATAPATLLGTNKGAAVWGTGMATWQYAQRVHMPWATLLPAVATALLGSGLGAWTLTVISPEYLRQALPLILLLVFLYTLKKKDLGQHHAPRYQGKAEMAAAATLGFCIGFYDGFFGPGTGSFFVFLFVRWLGFDFLRASASAKLLNTATNVSALALFTWKGHVWWHFALVMGVANVVGSVLGTRLALRHGTGFVRHVFIVVVGALILKTGYDAFIR